MGRKNLKRKRDFLRKNKNEHSKTLTDIFPFILTSKIENKNE